MSQPNSDEVLAAPASFAQERLWFLQKLEGSTSSYNIQVGLRFRGRFRPDALGRGLAELERRHEVLRTTFGLEGRTLTQYIEAEPRVALETVDLSSDPAPDKELERWAREESRRALDQERGPLFRAHLLRLADDDHVLLLVFDHLICDAWSLRILYEELTTLYLEFAEDEPHLLAELPVQYADYAAWQRQLLNDEEVERQLAFWRRHLADPPERLRLSAPEARAQDKRSGSTSTVELPPDLVAALEALARSEGTSLFVGLLTVFSALLYRYTGQPDHFIGTIVDNRTREEVEPLIGFFSNTLALRFDATGQPSFRELLGRVRETWLDAHEHQELPFDHVVRELRPERSRGRQPYFDVMMQFADVDLPVVERPGLRVEVLDIGFEPAPVDLLLGIVRLQDRFVAFWDHDERLFDTATISLMQRHYTRLLERAVADPTESISALELLDGEERRRVLYEWSVGAAGLETVLGCGHSADRDVRALVVDERLAPLPPSIPGRLLLVGELPGCDCVDGEDLTGNPALAELLDEIPGSSAWLTGQRVQWSPAGRLIRVVDPAASSAPDAASQPATPGAAGDGEGAEFERVIADIWSEVLKRDAIGPGDDFFDLGGHSLAAAQVITRLAREFGLDVALDVLFERSELRDFALAVLELEAQRT
jgi:hypothetical protein